MSLLDILDNSSIRKANERVITQTFEDFGGVDTLAIFRKAPFKFSLLSPKSVTSPFDVYLNTDYTKAGAKTLIEFIRDLSIQELESWNDDQLQQAGNAETLFIIYNDFNNIKLDFSDRLILLEEVEADNPDAEKVLVSHDTSDTGLIAFVNELIDWM